MEMLKLLKFQRIYKKNHLVQAMLISMIEVIFNYVLESVETALKANGCKFKGKEITVQRARMQKKKIIK